jgi:hypothetical protein
MMAPRPLPAIRDVRVGVATVVRGRDSAGDTDLLTGEPRRTQRHVAWPRLTDDKSVGDGFLLLRNAVVRERDHRGVSACVGVGVLRP